MPTVSEISSGQQFQRTADQNGLADSQTRVFRVLLSEPGEVIDIQEECEVYIGDVHPYNKNIYCKSFTANFEGNSRMVILCTFQYQSTAGADSAGDPRDPQQDAPDVRLMEISTSTSLMEKPSYSWKPLGGAPDAGNWIEPRNPAGDLYEGITRLEPIVNITITGFEAKDPLKHCLHVGKVNDENLQIGSLFCVIRTLMFRGVSAQPVVESWGEYVFRGWKATYEFSYRANWTRLGGGAEIPLGWDIAVPQTGFNVRAFTPAGGADDWYGQPLKHAAGRIGFDNGLPVLPSGVNDGDKVRAMVRVHDYEDGGVSQTPSAQPIPLNDNGRPRGAGENPRVLVYRYQIYEELNFMETFGLRLPQAKAQ